MRHARCSTASRNYSRRFRLPFAINELDIDAHAVAGALHRTLKDVANAELLADLLQVDMLFSPGFPSQRGRRHSGGDGPLFCADERIRHMGRWMRSLRGSVEQVSCR
jgi:hypothetical protein